MGILCIRNDDPFIPNLKMKLSIEYDERNDMNDIHYYGIIITLHSILCLYIYRQPYIWISMTWITTIAVAMKIPILSFPFFFLLTILSMIFIGLLGILLLEIAY